MEAKEHDRFDPNKATETLRKLRDRGGVAPESLFCEPDEPLFLTDPDAIPSQLPPEATEDLDFMQQLPDEVLEREPVILKGVLTGDDFRRRVDGAEDLILPDGRPLMQKRRVVIGIETDTQTSETAYRRFLPGLIGEADDFPQERLKGHVQRERFDPQIPPEDIGRTLKTQRKKFSSTAHWTVDEGMQIKSRGGDAHRLVVGPRHRD